MRKLLGMIVLASACGAVSAGKPTVRLADLAALPAARMSQLKDVEFEVSQAHVALAGAKETAERERGLRDDARRGVKPVELDLKAAQVEQRAAKANHDVERVAAAEAQVAAARDRLRSATLLVRWRDKMVDTSRLEIAREQSRLELAQAKLELARVYALIAENLPAAGKYSVAEFEKRVNSTQKAFERAANKARQSSSTADDLQVAWTRSAGPDAR